MVVPVLLHTWIDRDLSLAGRVTVQTHGGVETLLLDFARPLLRVPSLAIHLCREIKQEGLKLEVKADFKAERKHFKRIRELIEQRDYEKVKEITAGNPDYSKMVCRCENITEAEVVAAIHRGHTTLDSLKFATRIGTGRCQGGFCTYRVMKILHRETGIPFEKISKKGPGSEIVPYPLAKGGAGS